VDSPFHHTHGYYADVVDEMTAHLPAGWRARARVVVARKEPPVRAICPEANDLVAAKLVAGREKDRDYACEAFKTGVASMATVGRRLQHARADENAIDQARAWLKDFRRIRKSILTLYASAGRVLAGQDADGLRHQLNTVIAKYTLIGALLHEDFRAALLDAERALIVKAARKAGIQLPDLSAPS
jgi:hypothetical protein